MEDDLKKKMEDGLKKMKKWKTTSEKRKKKRWPQKKMEDDLKHNLKNQP